ncbi:hypothetical protein HJFPF1_11288 [Paramyrothecium foliicola]|nr:hypothetical protein HJFPF1_11288 [Paramyrothecium foliicola]
MLIAVPTSTSNPQGLYKFIMKEFPRKFLSLRDKNGAQRRSKSVPPGHKAHALSTETFMSMFKNDASKNHSKDNNDKEKDDPIIESVQRRLQELGISNVSLDHIRAILDTKYAEGDPLKTADFIDIEQKAAAGIITSYDPSVHMAGAENRGNVTCYLDALLFAMFCRMDAFECMLKVDFPPDDHKNTLVKLLRMWVNMLRSGKLIRTDMTKLIQDALADCGWSDARMLEQQDTSEAFAFLTETLQLPLLSLQVDLFHQGKRDADDHKVVYERLLNLAVPPDPEGKGIKLEDCLEEYFNAKVDVLRDSEEAKKAFIEELIPEARPAPTPRSSLRIVTPAVDGNPTAITASPVAISPLAHQHEQPENQTSVSTPKGDNTGDPDPTTEPDGGSSAATPTRPTARHRSTSVIQRVVLDERGRPATPESPSMLQKAMRKGSTVVKAVTIPAWQFFRLIPWHALNSNEPSNDLEVAMNFDQKPVVGICLKRYVMTEDGYPKRHNTFIDIPDSLRLPHFMLAGDTAKEDPRLLNTDYKLVLQSVVCHRGDSVYSGHYIAFARVAPKLLTGNRRHNFDPPPDYEEAQWVMFDDLDDEGRVTYVDNIREALKEEMPYLLFYQIVPMVDVAPPSTEDAETEPPSYNASKVSIELPPTPTANENPPSELSPQQDGYFDAARTAGLADPRRSKPPSIRLSADFDRPSRKSIEETGLPSYASSTVGDSRRPSMNLTDSTAITPAVTPDGHSPAATPGDETTASRLSRAASRFAKGKQSRPGSQSGEGRISITMTRLSGLMRQSKEPLVEPNTLSISSTNSIGAPGSDNSHQNGTESSGDQEKPQLPSQPTHASSHGKHGHKRVKSKDKVGKQKSNAQPERECTVM